MKRVLVVILVLSMMLLFVACGSNVSYDRDNNESDKKPTSGTEIEHTGKKLSGKIIGGSVFSEGLAFVAVSDNSEITYCINKDGYIVFEISEKLVLYGIIDQRFVNGHVLINGGICDTSGKITYPEDVGASKFYDIAFSGGYIIAEKVTSDYSSTKNELGVLNFEYEWVIEPSEALYAALEDGLYEALAIGTRSFYSDGIAYFDEAECGLNINTGEIVDKRDVKIPSVKWRNFADNTYRDSDENVILDLSKTSNIVYDSGSEFVNGKAPIRFYNQSANKSYITLVDESGKFQFEPVEVVNVSEITYMDFDGDSIVVLSSDDQLIQCYNSKGELIGELDTSTLNSKAKFGCKIDDGVIKVSSGSSNLCFYFNTDFTPLFELETEGE